MVDFASFASAHPAFCVPAGVRVPGLGAQPALDGARPFPLTTEHLVTYRAEAAKDPAAISGMLKLGAEAIAFYVSFRLHPERWGIYVREGALRALREEYHRIVWRDLGKYADKPIDDVAERVEYTLALDYLLAHNKIHFLVDKVAAEWEAASGTAMYGPYQATWYAAVPKPSVTQPEDIGNLEEALANMEAFRQYINPSYADSVSKLVEGRLDERNVNEWKAFFIGGRFAVEMANVFSRQPPGWKDFARFLNRKTSVGATNYVRIQYSYNPEMLERGQIELSRRLAGGTSDVPNLFKAEVTDFPPVYLL